MVYCHYENMPIQIYRKFHLQKLKIVRLKNSDIFFHISAKNIDCGYSLEPPRQSMFWLEIRKIMHTPVNPTFTIWKWGLRGSELYRYVFVMNRYFYDKLFCTRCSKHLNVKGNRYTFEGDNSIKIVCVHFRKRICCIRKYFETQLFLIV